MCPGLLKTLGRPPALVNTVLPVLLFLTADLEAVVEREGLESVPVCQLHPQGVLPLAGQLVDVLVPQPVLCRQSPEALRARRKTKGSKTETGTVRKTRILPNSRLPAVCDFLLFYRVGWKIRQLVPLMDELVLFCCKSNAGAGNCVIINKE